MKRKLEEESCVERFYEDVRRYDYDKYCDSTIPEDAEDRYKKILSLVFADNLRNHKAFNAFYSVHYYDGILEDISKKDKRSAGTIHNVVRDGLFWISRSGLSDYAYGDDSVMVAPKAYRIYMPKRALKEFDYITYDAEKMEPFSVHKYGRIPIQEIHNASVEEIKATRGSRIGEQTLRMFADAFAKCGYPKLLNEINASKKKKSKNAGWHDLRENANDLPKPETPVDIAYLGYNNQIRTARAFYEDGTIHSEDSVFCGADELDEWCEYCEETDDYIIPECWIECASFCEQCALVDRTVIAWAAARRFEGGDAE